MFTVDTMIVMRRSSPHHVGRKFSCRSAAGCQLPVHEFRSATVPVWLRRQERTLDDDDASRRDIPFATAVSRRAGAEDERAIVAHAIAVDVAAHHRRVRRARHEPRDRRELHALRERIARREQDRVPPLVVARRPVEDVRIARGRRRREALRGRAAGERRLVARARVRVRRLEGEAAHRHAVHAERDLLVVGLQIRPDLDHVPERRHGARLREVDGAGAGHDASSRARRRADRSRSRARSSAASRDSDPGIRRDSRRAHSWHRDSRRSDRECAAARRAMRATRAARRNSD